VTQQKAFDAQKNDLFCVGVCLFVCIVGGHPWRKSCRSDEVFVRMTQGQCEMSAVLREWEKEHLVNAQLLEVFSLLFVPETRRASISELRECAWLKSDSSE